jgi:predicted small secreted protein
MRPLAVLFIVTASLALHGCGNTCQDLGDRLCQCSGAGSTRDACKTEIKNQLAATGVHSNDEAVCSAALATCNPPSGASFCEWVNTGCGKASCGLSNEAPASVCK